MSLIISVSIQAFELVKYWQLQGRVLFSSFLKHLGFCDFLITMRCSFPPAAFTKKVQVFLCLDCFPPVHFFPFSFKLFAGKPRQKPACFVHVPYVTYNFTGSLFPALYCIRINSPFSPTTVIKQILCKRLNDSSHQLEDGKPVISSFSAIIYASSCSIAPETGVQQLYHSHKALLTASNFSIRNRFVFVCGSSSVSKEVRSDSL